MDVSLNGYAEIERESVREKKINRDRHRQPDRQTDKYRDRDEQTDIHTYGETSKPLERLWRNKTRWDKILSYYIAFHIDL